MSNTCLIIGISGQDGSYLAKYLLERGYKVIGLTRSSSSVQLVNLERLSISSDVQAKTVDATNFKELEHCIRQTKPDEIYNLGGQSSVADSYLFPKETFKSIVDVTLNCVEAIRRLSNDIKFYNAASSECFGNTSGVMADEMTPFRPISPYGIAKSASYYITKGYRDSYGLFACSGILFNHESPLRNEKFVTQKVILGALEIAAGRKQYLELGNLDIERDWGWAPEYVQAIYRIMQHEQPDDFVIATGRSESLRNFVDTVFSELGLSSEKHVKIDSRFIRPTEIKQSRSNPKKAFDELGWRATKDMKAIVVEMLQAPVAI